MRDIILKAAEQLGASWKQDAAARRKRSAPDTVADTLESCASELVDELARVADASRSLTVEQFAKEHGHTASTVRRWCLRGVLDANKNTHGDWEIPRDARRVKQPARQLQATG